MKYVSKIGKKKCLILVARPIERREHFIFPPADFLFRRTSRCHGAGNVSDSVIFGQGTSPSTIGSGRRRRSRPDDFHSGTRGTAFLRFRIRDTRGAVTFFVIVVDNAISTKLHLTGRRTTIAVDRVAVVTLFVGPFSFAISADGTRRGSVVVTAARTVARDFAALFARTSCRITADAGEAHTKFHSVEIICGNSVYIKDHSVIVILTHALGTNLDADLGVLPRRCRNEFMLGTQTHTHANTKQTSHFSDSVPPKQLTS